MNPALLFLILIGAVVGVLGLLAVKNWKQFKNHPQLKNVPGGIIMVLSLAAIVAFTMWANRSDADELAFFKYAGMFVGVDYDKESIFCRKPAPDIVSDDRWTSNVGFKLNTLYWQQRNILLVSDLTYQHHSCAFNQDKPTYDAFGYKVQLIYFFK